MSNAAEKSSNSHDHEMLEEKRDPNTIYVSLNEKRRAALAELDDANFSWVHAKICLVAGVGFFTDAYDLFAINIASVMLGYLYGTNGALTAHQDLGVKVAAPVGTLFGQVIFGWMADVVGRKRMYGVELGIIIVSTFAQALAGQGHGVNLIGVLVMWRFILGVGIGGDYPTSAAYYRISEFASKKIRGRMMAALVSNQGWGNFSAALVSLVVVAAYRKQISNDSGVDPRHVDFCWRLLIGLGCVPGVLALYFRLTISETPRFTMDIERNVTRARQDVNQFLGTSAVVIEQDVIERAAVPKASRRDFSAYFSRWENLKVLIGTCYSWFAIDISFYGLGFNSSLVLNAIGFGKAPANLTGGAAVYQNLYNISVGNLILAVAGLIPGYYATFLLIDTMGRKRIQLYGFVILTILFVIMGFGYDAILAHSQGAFVFLYCLANFFQNFGPNTTVFIIPGELFPTRYRATAHGISAASGKLGAVIAQVGFAQLKDIGGTNKFVKHILEIFSLFMLTGVFSTLLLPETNQRSLEDEEA